MLSSDQRVYYYSLLTLYFIAPPTFISIFFVQAPYGKHHRAGWGPTMSPPLAWFLMESPTLWLTLLIFPFGHHRSNPKALLLISLFLFHYTNRTCLYPLRLLKTTAGSRNSGVSVVVVMLALVFNLLNTYVQARWVSHYADFDSDEWFWWRFGVGLVVFFVGMRVNVWADRVLMSLKRQGGGYKVPRGGLFELVSCPNYFGEIVEWLGWTLMTGSWAGFGFFLYTCANLVPRAWGNHGWYLEKFGEDYPKKRKAIIPFVY